MDAVINGPEPRTPEDFAEDYQLPIEAVLEASTTWMRIEQSSRKSEMTKPLGSAFADSSARTSDEVSRR